MTKIDTTKWKSFMVSDLFSDLIRGSLPIFRNLTEGTTPVIAASMYNQGITGYYNVPKKYMNHITVSLNGAGSGYFSYHNYGFAANSDCGILIERKPLTPNIALFLCTILNKIGENYGYEEKINKTKLFAESIKLPIDSLGNPDFAYMETYMKSIMEQQRGKLELLRRL